MKSLVVVATCPGRPYLRETLAALDERAGAGAATERWIVSDGPLDPPPGGWHCDEQRETLGSRHTFWRATRLAGALGADVLIWLEDDISPSRNLVPYMLGTALPEGAAFASFFDAGALRPEWPDGWYLAPMSGPMGHGLRCSQCLLFPARTVRYLAGLERFEFGEKAGLLEGAGSVDKAISFLVEREPSLGARYAIHHPQLIEHIGEKSAAHPGLRIDRPRGPWQRVATRWAGTGFDATSLPRDLPTRTVERDNLAFLI